MSATPPLSVIVTCHERGLPLDITLASIGDQRFVQPQVIVADRRAGETLAVTLNAALASATGDWVLFLEAGDRIVGDIILNEALHWLRRTEAGVAAGELACDSGRIVKLRSRVNPLARDFVPRAATFYRRALFAENGDFEISLAVRPAYELHLRLWKTACASSRSRCASPPRRPRRASTGARAARKSACAISISPRGAAGGGTRARCCAACSAASRSRRRRTRRTAELRTEDGGRRTEG